MKHIFSLLILMVLLFFATKVDALTSVKNNVNINSEGGDSSSTVRINNNINTGNTSSSNTGKTETKVNISQEGEGTSSVTVNGKEWKLEGPGEINVNESSTDTPSVEGANKNITPTPSQILTETPAQNSGPTQEEPNNLFWKVKELLNELISKLSNLF